MAPASMAAAEARDPLASTAKARHCKARRSTAQALIRPAMRRHGVDSAHMLGPAWARRKLERHGRAMALIAQQRFAARWLWPAKPCRPSRRTGKTAKFGAAAMQGTRMTAPALLPRALHGGARAGHWPALMSIAAARTGAPRQSSGTAWVSEARLRQSLHSNPLERSGTAWRDYTALWRGMAQHSIAQALSCRAAQWLGIGKQGKVLHRHSMALHREAERRHRIDSNGRPRQRTEQLLQGVPHRVAAPAIL